jgi:hypothetical protein
MLHRPQVTYDDEEDRGGKKETEHHAHRAPGFGRNRQYPHEENDQNEYDYQENPGRIFHSGNTPLNLDKGI